MEESTPPPVCPEYLERNPVYPLEVAENHEEGIGYPLVKLKNTLEGATRPFVYSENHEGDFISLWIRMNI